jgi:exosortase
MTPFPSTSTEWKDRLPRPAVLASGLALILLFLLTHGEAISVLVERWWQEPEYGHGFFVPVFAIVLLWLRRDMMDPLPTRGSWWAIPFLAVWAAMRWASAYFLYRLLDPASMIPCLVGVTLLVGGWRALRWAWPSIFFLVFMIPLPGFLADRLSLPLQKVGTVASTYAIQTIGISAVAQGNVIKLTSGDLGVAEACSGLRMLMLFFAISIGAALVMKCTAWEKAIIVASAVPIAIIANVARLALTAILYETVSPEFGAKTGHDLAGWLMMPLALLLLWAEMTLLSHLLLEPIQKSSLSVSLARSLREGIEKPEDA